MNLADTERIRTLIEHMCDLTASLNLAATRQQQEEAVEIAQQIEGLINGRTRLVAMMALNGILGGLMLEAPAIKALMEEKGKVQ